jgi:integrase
MPLPHVTKRGTPPVSQPLMIISVNTEILEPSNHAIILAAQAQPYTSNTVDGRREPIAFPAWEPVLHFHDLRHAGNIWASKAGMSTKDLMARMGHDDMRAALIYQRATSDADQRIADKLSGLVDEHRAKDQKDDGDGSAGAPVPVG